MFFLVPGNTGARGHFNNNTDNNSGGGGFRGRGGFHRGIRGGTGNDSSRFYPRGSNRANGHEHSSTRRSSRSPDHSYSYRRDHDSSSNRPLPTEALRKNEKSNFDPSSNESSHN